ncbi:unnamed protein product (macronuclear) [Paramecium tetraurelia]|uniref:Uncharacterized protein n=1 Tax=Paramecium tetraurelia TaxID=5888 RepID=A0D491_PARTE|nr:uncharacterized protein GSPATT00013324001 [Paramecium tetraurelia]CAK77858.1 unnamed protein product [Paramecium tetraurelia]|eukprot:XP_001445255.1 hypothetical protein (macronuclear) [Paramecium tetraurelia strain d4-2]
MRQLSSPLTTLQDNLQSKSMPRIHSKQEQRFQLPTLKSKINNLIDSEDQKAQQVGQIFQGLVKGKTIMEQKNKIEFPKTSQNFYRIIYKAQYSFRPTKLNPRQVSMDQPAIQKKLGGPAFAFRTIQTSEEQLRKPNLEVIARQQVNYLNDSQSINESLNTEINQILYGKGQKKLQVKQRLNQANNNNDTSNIIKEESENSFI